MPAFSNALCTSNRCAPRGVSGSVRVANDRAATPIGTLIANSHGQDATDRMPAATVGPSAVPVPTTMAFTPTPRPSLAFG